MRFLTLVVGKNCSLSDFFFGASLMKFVETLVYIVPIGRPVCCKKLLAEVNLAPY